MARLEAALRECISTAAELRRHISPKSCGRYTTYREVWDASMAANASPPLPLGMSRELNNAAPLDD